MKKLSVLIACEWSGTVRDAFLRAGHDAISCDLLPTESPGPHYQGDVFDIINDGFDLMIAHPPCTYLSRAANYVWNAPGRAELRSKAIEFVEKLWNADIPHICIENPVGALNSEWKKPAQIVHPFYFGDREKKRTCFWLKNLPPLLYFFKDDLFNRKTATEPPQHSFVWINKHGKVKKEYFTYGKAHNGKARSQFFPSFASAMVEQWGAYLQERYAECSVATQFVASAAQ